MRVKPDYQRRRNATHRSLTDPEARLARRSNGQESRLAHGWLVLMENQNGLIIDVAVSEANGTAERNEALTMLRRSKQGHGLKPRTLAADKGYDAGPFLRELEDTEQLRVGASARSATRKGSGTASAPRRSSAGIRPPEACAGAGMSGVGRSARMGL